jgi:hypothetical protein
MASILWPVWRSLLLLEVSISLCMISIERSLWLLVCHSQKWAHHYEVISCCVCVYGFSVIFFVLEVNCMYLFLIAERRSAAYMAHNLAAWDSGLFGQCWLRRRRHRVWTFVLISRASSPALLQLPLSQWSVLYVVSGCVCQQAWHEGLVHSVYSENGPESICQQ